MKHNHDFRHIKTAEIRGRKFKVIWRSITTPSLNITGQCDWPGEKNKAINICKTRDPFEVLMTIVHEFTHGAFFDLDEVSVTEFDKDLRRFLTRCKIKVQFPLKRKPTHHAKKSHKKT